MGPRSKLGILEALSSLIEATRRNTDTLARIEGKLDRNTETTETLREQVEEHERRIAGLGL